MNVFAQIIQFQKTYSSISSSYECTGIINTSDGGYLVTSNRYDTLLAYDADGAAMKIDAAGNVQWTKSYGGVTDDYIYSACELSNGDYILVGESSSFVSSGSWSILVIRTDNNGVPIWTKTISYLSAAGAKAIKKTFDGNLIITGAAVDSNGAKTVQLKMDANGNVIWANRYGNPNFGKEIGNDIIQTSDSGFISVGRTSSYGSGVPDIYLVRTDASGNLLWTKTFGGVLQEDAYSLLQTSDGGFVIAGITNSFNSGWEFDFYVIKTDVNGNLLWSKTYANSNNDDQAFSITSTPDGGFAVFGYTMDTASGIKDFLLIKIDNLGNQQWAKTYDWGFEDYSASMKNTNDGGFVLTGSAYMGTFVDKIYIVKTDSLGISGCSEFIPTVFVSTPPTVVSTGGVAMPFGIIAAANPTVNLIDMIDSTKCLIIGINEISNYNLIGIYPNPTSGAFQIQVGNGQLAVGKVEIYNVLGENIYKSSVIGHQSSSTIDLSSHPKGIYFVKVISEDGMQAVRKLILQ